MFPRDIEGLIVEHYAVSSDDFLLFQPFLYVRDCFWVELRLSCDGADGYCRLFHDFFERVRLFLVECERVPVS